MLLNEYFEKVFCINLERRKDRFLEASDEFAKHDIDVEFVKAIDGHELTIPQIVSEDGTLISPGYFGCLLSHLQVVREAKNRGLKNYCVFEDDCDLSPRFQKFFSEFIVNVPDDWDMIYFGGNNMEKPKMIADNVARISKTYTTHAFAAKETIYDAMIEAWDKIEKLDITLSKLHKHFNCYIFQPHLVMQRPSFSDILNRFNDDWTLNKRHN